MPKKKDDILLSSKHSIGQVETLINAGAGSKAELAEFVSLRLTERYINPSKNVPREFKNGFSIMANCCLLIETYECFRQGLAETPYKKGQSNFTAFFDREALFIELKGLGGDFYSYVRNGILHQGETKQGWTITRNGKLLFDPKEKQINANKFLTAMGKTLEAYKQELIDDKWEDPLWKNCLKKIDSIIKNC